MRIRETAPSQFVSSPPVGLTRDLCVIIHGTSGTALGAECVGRVKQAIADGIAVALAGCREPPVAIGDGLDGKFSLQYTAAAALLDGAVNIDTFVDERRFRADMVALLGKTTLVQDASIAGDFHHMRVEIEVELDDGKRLAAVCRGPQGSWGVPLARGGHRAKLRDCVGRALPSARTDELLDALDRLEQQDAAGVAKIIALIAAAG